MKTNPVIHFEMPAEDRERVAKFYTNVFGWKTKQYGIEYGNYVLATTTETDEKGMIKTPGNINGGFFTKTDSNQSTKVVIAVDDIRDTMKRVVEAGGRVIDGRVPGEPENMPGLGLFALIVDTEGNQVSLMQPTSGSEVDTETSRSNVPVTEKS